MKTPSKSFYKWGSVTALAGILVLFTHCGKPSAEKGDLIWSQNGISVSQGGKSAASSLQAFQQTVYPITRARCASCHGSSQQPLHASANATTAHNAIINSYKVDFSNIPNSRMVRKLVENHNCWGSCTANAMEMQLAIQEWKDLMESSPDNDGPVVPNPGNYDSVTGTSQTLVQERINAGLMAGAPVTVRFSLNSLGFTNARIEVRIEEYDQYSYRLSQLRLVTPNTALRIKGVHFMINGTYSPQNANLTQVDQTVAASAAGTVLTPSSMIVLKDQGDNVDRFSIGFEILEQ